MKDKNKIILIVLILALIAIILIIYYNTYPSFISTKCSPFPSGSRCHIETLKYNYLNVSVGRYTIFFLTPDQKEYALDQASLQENATLIFEEMTGISINKEIKVYFMQDNSCCEASMCSNEDYLEIYYGNVTNSPNDIHEQFHIIYSNSLRLPNYWFEEPFVWRTLDLINYQQRKKFVHKPQFSNYSRCKSHDDACICKYKYLIHKIDQKYGLNNTNEIFKMWVSFIKKINEHSGASNERQLFDIMNESFLGIDKNLEKWGYI